jgi:hypothetical protein
MNKKINSILFSMILIASIAMTSMPTIAQFTNPQTGGSKLLPSNVTPDVTYKTICYVSFRPNPIGVGQSLLVNLWMQPPISVLRYFEKGYQVTFTKPDGTTDVIGPLDSFRGDTTAWFEYTPDQIGTWQIKADFLGGYFPPGNTTFATSFGQSGEYINQTLDAPLGVYYAPSHDGPYNFTVQEQPAGAWPTVPLPTDYWTRPASFEMRDWWPILGNYPGTGTVGGGPGWPADTNTYMSNYQFTPYVQGPKSAHVVWKEARADGGLIGGNLGQLSFTNAGNSFSIIYNGMCYGTDSKRGSGTTAVTYWQCYDLRTGELIWERPLATGESAPNMLAYTTRTVSAVPGDTASARNHGVDLMYVGGGRLIKYNAWTGAVNLNISISPLTTGTFYANSESAPLFLSVQDLGSTAGSDRYRLINWTIIGTPAYPDIINRRIGIISNISWPFSSIGTVDYESAIAVDTVGITPSSTQVAYGQIITAASLTTGKVLWNITTDTSTGLEGFFSGSTRIADHGKFAVRENDGHWHCWDLQTGKELWVGELSSWPWGTFGIYGVESAYGLLYYPQYDGVVAWNWTTGKIAWRYAYYAEYPYETVYEDALYPFYDSVVKIADGMIYTSNTEHTASQPATRGWKLHCINATSGEGIWNITGSMAANAIADGYLVANNRNDGFLYTFGKGKSAMTLTAPDVVISKGTGVVIKGTVLDMSPAQPGTPCISAGSMATQMEYLHMELPIDGVDHQATITGVPVSIDAIDPNGNYIHIGDAVTNGYGGDFGFTWTPQNEGQYSITASFAGDDSYGSSLATTTMSVGSTLQATSTSQTQASAPDYTMTIVSSAIGIAIVVVISAAVVILILRKR